MDALFFIVEGCHRLRCLADKYSIKDADFADYKKCNAENRCNK